MPSSPMGRSQGGEPKASALQQRWEHTAAPGPGQGGQAGRSGCLTCPWLRADFMKRSIKLFFLTWCPEKWKGEKPPGVGVALR